MDILLPYDWSSSYQHDDTMTNKDTAKISRGKQILIKSIRLPLFAKRKQNVYVKRKMIKQQIQLLSVTLVMVLDHFSWDGTIFNKNKWHVYNVIARSLIIRETETDSKDVVCIIYVYLKSYLRKMNIFLIETSIELLVLNGFCKIQKFLNFLFYLNLTFY